MYQQKHKKDKKSKKDKKKEKKEKKAHKQKPKEVEPISEEQWVVVSDASSNLANITSNDATKVERESWMISPPTRESQTKEVNEDKQEEDKVEKHVSERELNPYMKEGTGVPNNKDASSIVEETKVKTVGDGGAGWRSKILNRVKQQAMEEGKSMEEIAENRWDLKQLEKTTTTTTSNDHKRYSNKGSFASSDYLKDQRHKMMAPSKSNDLKWSKHKPTTEKMDTVQNSNDREYRDRDNEYRDREYRDRDRDREYKDRNRDRDREHGDRDRDRDNNYRDRNKLSTMYSTTISSLTIPDQNKIEKESENTIENESTTTSTTSTISKDPNQLAAQMMKAKLSGNQTLYAQLQQELEELKNSQVEGGVNKRKNEVIIPIDERGKPIQLEVASKSVRVSKRGKFETYDKESKGERARYYPDDDNVSLNDLVANEKLNSTNNSYNDNFSKNIINRPNYKFDMEEFGDHPEMWESNKKKKSTSQQEKLQKSKAIAGKNNSFLFKFIFLLLAHNKMNSILENCWFCFDNPKIDKSLIVSLGNSVYLALPKRGRLADGHCLIIPMSHTTAINMTEEDVWEEVQLFRKCLLKMFASKNKDVVFFEVAMEFNKQRHTFIECIPVPKKVGQEAPLYFKKAIIESESEWSQHKKVIETKGRGLRKSIPQGFPYFFVEFGIDYGYVHVIEQESKFSRQFGRVCLLQNTQILIL